MNYNDIRNEIPISEKVLLTIRRGCGVLEHRSKYDSLSSEYATM